MKSYPNVDTRSIIKDVPCGPGWEQYRGCMIQEHKVLQTVALLATDIARILLHMTTQEFHAKLHGEEDRSTFKNWTPEELATKSCDIATALYMEFQERDWFLDAPGPEKITR